MTDVLIRDVPDDVVAQWDERALALGLSRTEYLRRRLMSVPRVGAVPTDSFAKFKGLSDEGLMTQAWS